MKKAKGKSLAIKTRTELVDPRKINFLTAFCDPASPTFANALQSGLASGFSEEYSSNITAQMPAWLRDGISETLGNEKRVRLAEKHMDEVLEMPIITQSMGAFGPLYEKKETFTEKTLKNGKTKRVRHVEKVPIMTYNTSRIKEKSKVAEFALEALKKATYGKAQGGPKLSFTFNAASARAKYEA